MSATVTPFSEFKSRLEARQAEKAQREQQLAEVGLRQMQNLYPELCKFNQHSYMDYWLEL